MKDRESDPRPAPPEDSPFLSLVGALNARLRAEAPTKFAGIGRGPDGAVEVYATVSDPAFTTLVEEVHLASGSQVPVRVAAGMKNSLASLERLFARIRERAQELHNEGIPLVQFGVHVSANRVHLGVEGLTPEIAESLKCEFGADRVEIAEGGRFEPM
jgi:hypothetical protein